MRSVLLATCAALLLLAVAAPVAPTAAATSCAPPDYDPTDLDALYDDVECQVYMACWPFTWCSKVTRLLP